MKTKTRIHLEEINDAAHQAHPDAFREGGVVGVIEFLRAEKDELAKALESVAEWLQALRGNPFSPLHQGETRARLQQAAAVLAKVKP